MPNDAYELEGRDVDTIQAAIEDFHRRAGLLSATVFLLSRYSAKPHCIADCGHFPIERAHEPIAVRPRRGCLEDRAQRFLLVWFYPQTLTDEAVDVLARDTAETISSALDAFADRQARAWFRTRCAGNGSRSARW